MARDTPFRLAVFWLTMDNTYLFSNFVTTKQGDGYRLFPFGKVVKGGREHIITPELAKLFKLPHFKPAIKLGSHEETTPAGGHIIGLEVREDGLYAIPEWNEQGIKALNDGAYRYQSPEIIWQDGGLEDPTSGNFIEGPMILGDALLHTPHLGEATAMYSITEIKKEINMEGTVNVPANLWEKFTAFIDSRLNPPEPQKVEVVPEDYEAAKKARDEYKAQLDAMEAEKVRLVRVEKFETELKETKADPTLAELLAGLPDEQAEAVMKQFRALSEQINADALTKETGSEGGAVEDPKAAFNALVLEYSAKNGITYDKAFEIVKVQNKELFTAWAVKEK